MFEMSFQVHCYYNKFNNLYTRTATYNEDPSIQDAQFSVGLVVAEQLFVLAAAMPYTSTDACVLLLLRILQHLQHHK